MEVEPKIKILCQGNKVIECDGRLIQFSDQLQQSNQKINFQFNESTLSKIIEFYELFNYNHKEFKQVEFKKKVVQILNLLKVIKDYFKYIRLKPSKTIKLNLDALTELTEASYQYNFKALKKVLIKAIGTEFYCGKTEEEIDEFKEKFQLPIVIDPSEQERIMKGELKDVFDNLNAQLNQQFAEHPPLLNNISDK